MFCDLLKNQVEVAEQLNNLHARFRQRSMKTIKTNKRIKSQKSMKSIKNKVNSEE